LNGELCAAPSPADRRQLALAPRTDADMLTDRWRSRRGRSPAGGPGRR
jgi:hypothetical protein